MNDDVGGWIVILGAAAVLLVAVFLAEAQGRNTERSRWCAEYLAQAPTAADSLRLYHHPVHPCPLPKGRGE